RHWKIKRYKIYLPYYKITEHDLQIQYKDVRVNELYRHLLSSYFPLYDQFLHLTICSLSFVKKNIFPSDFYQQERIQQKEVLLFYRLFHCFRLESKQFSLFFLRVILVAQLEHFQ